MTEVTVLSADEGDEPEFSVRTGLEGRQIGGVDTLIAIMKKNYYADINGERTLVVAPFVRDLRTLAEASAAQIGERLHHGDFWITSSPATVEAKGRMHDCDNCRAGVARALQHLRENPRDELVVGVLYWAVM